MVSDRAPSPGERPSADSKALEKAPTGIEGLDEVMHGGFPKGRPTLICGGPGSGKTLLGVTFLANGILDYDEPGVFVAFEESARDLEQNSASLGFDLPDMIKRKKLIIDHIETQSEDTRDAGDFTLDGLFIRLGYAIDQVGAKRIVLDTLENLFTDLPDPGRVRMEVHRLFNWLKDKGITAVVTAESGPTMLTRQGMEEYVSDCVISLEQSVVNQVSTRRLRIVKFRGSAHGTNLYPFIIDERGFSVAPITGSSLLRKASKDRISTGVSGLDKMLEDKGVYRGSTVLISGTAGTGKTTLASHMVDAACSRGEKCLFFSFEQGPDVILRDSGRLGDRLRKYVKEGLVRFVGARPTAQGLDEHLTAMRVDIQEMQPDLVVIDPITGFGPVGADWEARNMLILLMDTVASVGATLVLTSLSQAPVGEEITNVGISSLADVWILLRDIEVDGLRTRGMYVLKSRGIHHSRDVRAVEVDKDGLQVLEHGIILPPRTPRAEGGE